MRPAYLELKQVAPDTYDLLWKVPARGANERLALHVRLPGDCKIVVASTAAFTGSAYIERSRIARPGGLTGNDWYRPDYYATLAAQGGVARNPQGPPSSFDPMEPSEKKRLHRGGSFLCTDQYCTRYMVGTRGKGEIRFASNHLGFRLVMTPAMWESKPKSQNAARSS